MASSSNIHDASTRVEDFQFLYASNANVSNFVSVKLSSDRNYHLWKTQMICLMKSHNMGEIVDAAFVGPRASSTDMMDRYDNLLKGWIFGSVSENILGAISDSVSAKDVWDKLKSFYGATGQQVDVIIIGSDTVSTQSELQDTHPTSEIGRMEEGRYVRESSSDDDNKKNLRQAITKGDWRKAESILKKRKVLVEEAINIDGSTVLHSAVGIGGDDFVKNLIALISKEQALVKRSSDGSTALHIAALVGNTYAAKLLVEKNIRLLEITDNKGKEPFHKAYENMHLDSIGYLLKAIDKDKNGKSVTSNVGIGVDILVNAISAKKYNLALDMIDQFPEFAYKTDYVLLALAKTFQSGLDNWEILICPSLSKIWNKMLTLAVFSVPSLFLSPWKVIGYVFWIDIDHGLLKLGFWMIGGMIYVVLWLLLLPFVLIILLILIISSPFLWVYSMLWKYTAILVPPINHIKMKKNEWIEATKVLELVCDKIDKLPFGGSHHPFYSKPLLEAASQNAHKVVYEILSRSPNAIRSIDKNGYDIIQLAVIHRSEKIYNLIYDIGENANRYRTFKDYSKNNMLHLAGRLAPLHELNRRSGAALQLQRELQWREKVKKLVFPTYLTQENIFKETPDMVFTREHENLVKEGEKWMKKTTESCSIAAALNTTIVFAAAITVPGGSNQQTGILLFNKELAFTIFAVFDAISLFASSASLLVFISILTARFAETDFLVSLPRRLLMGLFFLLLSTTSMMVAFSASLFLVFCDQKLWMLAPICGLAFIPIAFFATLQFPLILDLFQSTYFHIFGKQRKSVTGRFKPDYMIRKFMLCS